MEFKRYNSDVYTISNNGNVMAFAVRYSNNMWGLNDSDDKKLTGARFSTAKDAFVHYKEIQQ